MEALQLTNGLLTRSINISETPPPLVVVPSVDRVLLGYPCSIMSKRGKLEFQLSHRINQIIRTFRLFFEHVNASCLALPCMVADVSSDLFLTKRHSSSHPAIKRIQCGNGSGLEPRMRAPWFLVIRVGRRIRCRSLQEEFFFTPCFVFGRD